MVEYDPHGMGYKLDETKIRRSGAYIHVVNKKDGITRASFSKKTGRMYGDTDYFHRLDKALKKGRRQ